MKKTMTHILSAILCILTIHTTAQVGINTDASAPDPSAMLDIKSTDKGLLIPRMTTAERDAIANPATGLMVFVTSDNTFYCYNGSAWAAMDTHWKANGSDIYFDGGDVAIGVTDPDIYSLYVQRDPANASAVYGYNGTSRGYLGWWDNNDPNLDLPLVQSVGVLGYGPNFSNNSRAAVYGYAENVAGDAYGGVFQAIGANGSKNYGIYVKAANSTNDNYAGYFAGGNTYFSDRVGIGVEIPTVKLDVNGLIRMSTGANGGYIPVSDANGIMTWTDPLTITTSNDGDWTVSGDDVYPAVSGNVGIGTSTPMEKLDVDGSIRMRTGASNGYIPVSDANGTMTWTDPLAITTSNDGDWTVSGDDVYSTVSGNVGIGTTTPTQKLDVAGSVTLNERITVTAGTQTLTLATNEANNYIHLDVGGSGHSGDKIFLGDLTQTKNDVIMMGDVGIGIDVPTEKLDINGQIRMRTGASNGYIPVSDANGTMTWTDPNTIVIGGDSDWATNITGDTVYTNANAVGIGLSNPATKLHVSDGDVTLQRANNANSTNILFQNSGSNYNWRLWHEGNDGFDDFVISGGNIDTDPDLLIERLRIDEGGDVDIAGSTVIGTIGIGSESVDQGTSAHSGDGFTTTPWLYTHAIEAANERGTGSTLITLGDDGTYGSSDQIHFVTEGNSQAFVSADGNLILRNENEFRILGANGNLNAKLADNGTNVGQLQLYNNAGEQRAAIFVDDGGSSNANGAALFFGPNGERNILLGYLGGTPNHGSLTVNDGSGTSQAGLRVDAAGNGIVWGDTKNFRMDHPADPDKEIWYASIEGPEAAAYVRGTAQLEDGQAVIQFPDHFIYVINESTLTITLTPRSADSRGLATVSTGRTGFEVRELMNGEGTYQFDWVAMAVRKGYEDYEVVREKKELDMAISVDE